MFERCEERLALSGAPLTAVAAEGGFISLGVGDFFSTTANKFLDADSSGFVLNFDLSTTPTISGAVVDSVGQPLSDSGFGLRVRQIEAGTDTNSNDDGSSSLPGDAVSPTADVASEKPSSEVLADGESGDELSIPMDLSVEVVADSPPNTHAVEALAVTELPRETTTLAGGLGELYQDDVRVPPVRSEPLEIGEGGEPIEPRSRLDDDVPTNLAEGGPIEVARAVVDTQHAFEAQVFSAVAALLDSENVLPQPQPPKIQPFAGELARSVAFETIAEQPTSDSARLDDSRELNGDISATSAAMPVGEDDTEPSRALAFAQWPLLFSATLRAVFVGTRRRGQSGTAQLPPRRNRQADVS